MRAMGREPEFRGVQLEVAERSGMGEDCREGCTREAREGEDGREVYYERHTLWGQCRECGDHQNCWVHSGVHYGFPVFHTIIRDLSVEDVCPKS